MTVLVTFAVLFMVVFLSLRADTWEAIAGCGAISLMLALAGIGWALVCAPFAGLPYAPVWMALGGVCLAGAWGIWKRTDGSTTARRARPRASAGQPGPPTLDGVSVSLDGPQTAHELPPGVHGRITVRGRLGGDTPRAKLAVKLSAKWAPERSPIGLGSAEFPIPSKAVELENGGIEAAFPVEEPFYEVHVEVWVTSWFGSSDRFTAHFQNAAGYLAESEDLGSWCISLDGSSSRREHWRTPDSRRWYGERVVGRRDPDLVPDPTPGKPH